MNKKSNPKIFFFAGEESGDIRSSEVIREILKIRPDVRIDAVGGKRMGEAGANVIKDITGFAVVGFVEVLKHYGFFKNLMEETVSLILKNKYDAVVLVDYPGFNLRLAERLKKHGIRIIYFISPQVWAWGKKRIPKIANLVDRMIVLFEFEKNIYAEEGLETVFCGHPIVDEESKYNPKNLRVSFNIDENCKIIGFLPGSRRKEIENILPPMLDAAKMLEKENVKFIVSVARKDLEQVVDAVKKRFEFREKSVFFYNGNASDVIYSSDIVVVASGTATIQTAFYEKPMIIVYKVAFFTWLIAKLLVKLPYIGMVNVMLGEKKIPELVQWDLNGKKLKEEIRKILHNESRIKEIKGYVSEAKKCLVKKALPKGRQKQF